MMSSSSRVRFAAPAGSSEDEISRVLRNPRESYMASVDDNDDDGETTTTDISTAGRPNVSSHKTDSENNLVPEEESHITDDIAEDTAVLKPKLKSTLGPQPKQGSTSDALRGQEKGESYGDSKMDEAHDGVQGYYSDGDESGLEEKRRPIMRAMSASRASTSLNVTPQEPNRGVQGSSSRGRSRGRPSKKKAMSNGTSESAGSFSATKESDSKRKRATGGDGDGLRRSSRAAAEFATQQITEQTKRPRLAETPSMSPTTGKEKNAATSASGGSGSRGRGRPTAIKTPVKTPTKTSAKSEYEVEFIIKTRKKSGATEYLVKWKGYHITESTWEPAANLTHCAKALKEFRSGGSGK